MLKKNAQIYIYIYNHYIIYLIERLEFFLRPIAPNIPHPCPPSSAIVNNDRAKLLRALAAILIFSLY